MKRVFALSTGILLACTSLDSVAQAQTPRYVPTAYGTIQAAVDAANAANNDYVEIVGPNTGDGTYSPFTLNKAIEVRESSSEEIIVKGTGSSYAAAITASGGKIIGLTLRGGSTKVVDVGPGTVQYCRIEDVSGTLQYDPAVVMGSSSGQFLDNTIIRTTSAKCVELSAAGSVKRCTFEITGTSQNDHAAIKTTSGTGGTIENNVITFASGLSYTTRGIESRYGNATIQYNTVKRATRGIDIEGGSNLITFNVLDDCTDGIYFEISASGDQTVTNNTVFRSDTPCPTGTCGIKMVSGSMYPTAVNNNLFINVALGIDCSNTTGATYSHNIYASRTCTSGSASDCSLTSSEIAVKECLLCEGRESSVEYFTQRIDSEAAKENNGWNEVVGAKDVQCAWGTLSRTTTLSANASATILEDVTVPNGLTLTLAAGSSLKADLSDQSAGGTDSGKNELIVAGTLVVNGTSGSPVTISSTGTTGENDWYGIRTYDDPNSNTTVKLDIDYATIKNATYGLRVNGLAASSSSEITHSSFASNGSYDIEVAAASSDLYIEFCTFDVGGGSGIRSADGLVYIKDNTISGDVNSSSGVLCAQSYPDHTALQRNDISGFSAGKGIEVLSNDPLFYENNVNDCKWGLYVSGGAPRVGSASDTTFDNVFSGNSSAGGFFTGSSTGGTVRQNRFTGNGKGLVTKGNANPDLGSAGSFGMNIFASNTTYCLQNQSTSGTVSARGNYLNGQNPPTCWDGSFDLNDYLTTLPQNRELDLAPVAALPGAILVLGVTPNPMTAATSIRLALTEDERRIGVMIHDVAGRLVRTLPERVYTPGIAELLWDGRSAAGVAVPTGLYFARITTEGQSLRTVKILVTR